MGKSETTDSLNYFFTGIIIESICFSLGLAYKIKLINDGQQKLSDNAAIAAVLNKTAVKNSNLI